MNYYLYVRLDGGLVSGFYWESETGEERTTSDFTAATPFPSYRAAASAADRISNETSRKVTILIDITA